jgi:hypothetical protein
MNSCFNEEEKGTLSMFRTFTLGNTRPEYVVVVVDW